jgi:hypothetical protein
VTYQVGWARKHPGAYEVSSVGDKRFSAFHAMMPDGRSIEYWYQCDIKGYDPGGIDWRKGKGNPPLIDYPGDELYQMYLSLWKIWAIRNPRLMELLRIKEIQHGHMLSDCFANSPINQARALAQILNDWNI